MYLQSNIRETREEKTPVVASIQQNDMHSIKHSINNMRTKTKIRITQSKNKNIHTVYTYTKYICCIAINIP